MMKHQFILPVVLSVFLSCCKSSAVIDASVPDIASPVLLAKPDNYNKLDYNTFPTYDVRHTIAPLKKERPQDALALWRTPDATYIVSAYKQLWNIMYFNCQSSEFIRDAATGEKYYKKETVGLPLDTTFWVKGIPGEWIVFVNVYPPLPEACTHIDIIETEVMDDIPNTTGWSGPQRIMNVSIRKLQANQDKMKFHETVIVE